MKCFQSRIQRLGWVILYSLMSFITLFTCYQFVGDAERIVYPVISDFKVGYVKRDKNVVTVRGSMDKHRACETVALNAYTEQYGDLPQLAPLNMYADGGTGKIVTRAVGVQNWGPWLVTVPAGPSKLSFFVRHRCNPLYDVTTALTDVDIQ